MSATIRIGNEVYRRVVTAENMTDDQAEVAATEIARDIGALALYLKEKGLDKDYTNMMTIADRFEKMANGIAKMGLQKAASSLKTAVEGDESYLEKVKRIHGVAGDLLDAIASASQVPYRIHELADQIWFLSDVGY